MDDVETRTSPEDAGPGATPPTESGGPRRIVLFADGTGNAYGGEASNIWRLHEALDLGRPDQIAAYVPGVGTQSLRILRLIDGMTGFGVPSNVRKLYRFLCWNWRPGDEVHLFGFSRGAFTIRTLIGMIASQGLVPTVVDGTPIDHLGMQRLARDSWRRYRADRAERRWWSPITPMRKIRDAWLWLWGKRPGVGGDAAFRVARRERRMGGGDGQPNLHFVGLFDTVQAYGVPIEEFRKAIDRMVFPLLFKDQDMSPLVRHARHALSLDDERTTFHPVRIGHRAEEATSKPKDRCEDVEEVWFAGAHSDVGGGYPDDSSALVALDWMLERIEAAPGASGPLRLDPGAKAAIAAAKSAFGPRHDPRSGFGVFYRYDPRKVVTHEDFGGPPVIHASVVERMLHGSDHYAPVSVPIGVDLVATGGQRRPVATSAIARTAVKTARAGTGTPRLTDPDPLWRSFADDAVWWRRVAYFALVISLLVLAVMPLLISFFGWDVGDGAVAQTAAVSDRGQTGVRSILTPVLSWLAPVIPGWIAPWTTALIAAPWAILFPGTLAIVILWRSSWLRDTIVDAVRNIWFAAPPPERGPLWRFAGWMRRPKGLPVAFYRWSARWLMPGLAVLAIYGGVLLAVSRVTYEIQNGDGSLCETTPEWGKNTEVATGDATPPRVVSKDTVTAPLPFPAASPCWNSGLWVERGRHYTIRLTPLDGAPFFDRTIPSGAGGFTDDLWRHRFALPIRRWWRADWFQPIARIGAAGVHEWPLVAVDGRTAPPAGQRPKPVDGAPPPCSSPSEKGGTAAAIAYEPAPAELTLVPGTPPLGMLGEIPDGPAWTAAIAEHHARCLRSDFVAKFTAPASGTLRLYLNDAVIAVPFLPPFTGFYRNNRGAATVEIHEDADW